MAFENFFPPVAVIIAFLLGSIPFGLLIARLFKARAGTHANDVWPAGVLAVLLDVLKGGLSVALVLPFGVSLWGRAFGLDNYQFNEFAVWLTGLAAVLGSCYSPWLHFRGGKGVTTALGVVALLSPWAALGALVAFGLSFLTRRDHATASLSAVVFGAVCHLVINHVGPHLFAGAAMIFLILLRHEGDIDALLEDHPTH